ncbi:Superoxide dismutase [Cu-Zn] [Gracilariopsis chorda]|uniref:Superoxide dismutase [Cu-Zn] n=1 Tax=Gracilariopsis chorda TaxID=448386 RepID=A0A2V3IPW2_9FLOR|nr:Superoxide dismutase [Cu-Zn] [Gracilariopsis chorda]|eukprot:PXF43170.1 Superoxide dismutase [Cu-Zn] [Gracilariopsis chorda]
MGRSAVVVVLSAALLCAVALASNQRQREGARSLKVTSRHAVVPSFSESTCSALPTLICNVQPTDGNQVSGTVYLTPIWSQRSADSQSFACYTRVTASIAGLPGPKHGFHAHTYGDLSSADGKSTGGHFTNPAGTDAQHGYPGDATRHWGDFGNLHVGADGIAEYDRIDDVIRLGGMVGRSITIHAEDDKGVEEQPSGGAGSRVAYCVIGYANPAVVADA